jgi:hypothetical protein
MTFEQIIDQLRDGKGYQFGKPGISGYFYKAPFPEVKRHTVRDGAMSAITFWRKGERASPTLMLYDFDEDDWWIHLSDSPYIKPESTGTSH